MTGAGAQYAAGYGIQWCVRRVVPVPGTVAFTDTDDEHDEYGGYTARQESSYRDHAHREGHQAALPPSPDRRFPVNVITLFP
jgi:hypothetical protein